MARKVKCQYCGITDTSKNEMEFELVGKSKPIKKYFHKTCYQEYLKEKEFKEKEAKELEELKTTIENIFGIKQLPNQAYPFLQKLRNGEQVFGNQNMGKRYKQGYTYPLIKETFEYCEDTIQYWLTIKDFDGFMNAFKYALSIVIDKIYFVEKRAKERENKNMLIEEHIKQIEVSDEIFESNYKKKNDKDDILDFLDD